MKKNKSQPAVEDYFPNARARKAADDAIDKLDPQLPMTTFLDTWENAYFEVAGRSPFRGK
jgi:hypothetical protein